MWLMKLYLSVFLVVNQWLWLLLVLICLIDLLVCVVVIFVRWFFIDMMSCVWVWMLFDVLLKLLCGWWSSMCVLGVMYCLFLVLVVSSSWFIEVVILMLMVMMLFGMNCIVLQIVIFVVIDLLGEFMQRQMFCLEFFVVRRRIFVQILFVFLFCIFELSQMMWFFSNLLKMFVVRRGFVVMLVFDFVFQ